MKIMKIFMILLAMFALINVSGCMGPSVKIDFKLSWGGISGAIPFKDNNIGQNDERVLNVVVVNKEDIALEGLILEISVVNPEQSINFEPFTEEVVKIGPKGTSEKQSNSFKIMTSGTPTGTYKLKIEGIYDGEVVKSKEFTIDVV